jgi:hypothetical protein
MANYTIALLTADESEIPSRKIKIVCAEAGQLCMVNELLAHCTCENSTYGD